MENTLRVFENAEFGQIRTVEIDGAPWLVGKDVATALGYSNPSKTLQDHVDKEDKVDDNKLNNETLSSLGQRGGWLINESGLYSLILGSKLPSAKRFKHWVTSEVLPSIRKTGAYRVEEEKPNVFANLPVAQAMQDVRTALNEAKKLFKASDGMLLATAMATVSEVHKVNLKPFERLLTPATKDVANMNATELAQHAGVLTKTGKPNAAAMNKKLEAMGYQTRQGKNWRLTNEGRKYGEEMAFVNNGHSGYRILWGINVVPKLNSLSDKEELRQLKEILLHNYEAALKARNFLSEHGRKTFTQLSAEERAELTAELKQLTEVQVQ